MKQDITGDGSRPAQVLLVVEDDLYARTLSRWLSKRGWHVIRAAHAAEALTLWRSSRAPVALVDLDQDKLGGLALLAAGQTLSPAGRAVISTSDLAATRLSDETKARLGICGVTVRPCHIDAVVAALERVLDETAGHRTREAS